MQYNHYREMNHSKGRVAGGGEGGRGGEGEGGGGRVLFSSCLVPLLKEPEGEAGGAGMLYRYLLQEKKMNEIYLFARVKHCLKL